MQYNDYKEFISIEGLRKQVSISPMTRNEICEKAGINTDTLDPLLSRTKNQLTRIDTIAKLAYALDCKIDDLIEFKGIKFKDTYACYSRMPMNPKPELSYAPLFDMYYDLYGSNFKAKLEKALEKVHAVEVKSIQKTEVKNEAISYRRRINAGKPLTLPALYEICKALKCTPGCVFGCKGKYNWEKKNSPLNDFNFQNQKIKIFIFNNEKISLEIKRLAIREIEDFNSNPCPDDDINSYVLYDSDAKNLWLGKTNLLPNENILYPVEKVDVNSKTPFLCNKEWHEAIETVISSEVVKPLQLYFNGYFFFKNLRYRINGYKRPYFKERELTSFPVFKFNGEYINAKTSFSDFIQAYKNGENIFIYSKYFEDYENILNPKFIPMEKYTIEKN